MLGSLRFTLAAFVVAQHVLRVPHIGSYSVHAFFVLSGYLMTYIMHRTYGYTAAGMGSFAVNRALRLYPAYWATVLLTVLAILVLGADAVSGVKAEMRLPDDLQGLVSNLFMLFPTQFSDPRLSPPAWALTIELFWYAMIALGISRFPRWTAAWLASGIVMLLALYAHEGNSSNLRYGTLLSGWVPFAAGALLYHTLGALQQRFRFIASGGFFAATFGLFVAHAGASAAVAWSNGEIGSRGYFFYSNIAVCVMLVAAALSYKGKGFGKSADRLLGDLSYPLYLSHWLVAVVLSLTVFQTIGHGPGLHLVPYFLATMICTCLLSYAIVQIVERPIMARREAIKENLRKPGGLDALGAKVPAE